MNSFLLPFPCVACTGHGLLDAHMQYGWISVFTRPQTAALPERFNFVA
jgi:hypothetical protein